MSATTLSIAKETQEAKLAELKKVIGDEKYDAVMKQVQEREKALELAGVVKKETDMSQYATKEEVAAIGLQLTGIANAFTKFTEGFASAQTKERDELKTQMKEMGDKLAELYGDAPNFLKSKGKAASKSADTELSPTAPVVQQAMKLSEAMNKAAKEVDVNQPMGAMTAFVFGQNGQ